MPGVSSANYDVTADGERFLMVREDEFIISKRVEVVLNWAEEVKAKGRAAAEKK
jgi:hypothetical protein